MMKVMKGFTGLGGFLILLIGLAMLGVTIWAYVNSAVTFNNYTFLGFMIAFDILIILASVLGIIGIKKQNGVMICVFQIFVILFFFVFFSIGVTAKVLPGVIFEGNCTNSQNPLIQVANNVTLKGQVFFCSPLCPCGLTQDAITKANYTDADMIIIKAKSKVNGGPVRFQDCDMTKTYEQNQLDVMNVLNSIESAFDCSGWCQSPYIWPLYSFSDVNKGKPKVACYDTMKNKLDEYGSVIGISFLVSAGFLLLVCICGLCICCSPSRRSLPYSSRFVVNDNGYYRPV